MHIFPAFFATGTILIVQCDPTTATTTGGGCMFFTGEEGGGGAKVISAHSAVSRGPMNDSGR